MPMTMNRIAATATASKRHVTGLRGRRPVRLPLVGERLTAALGVVLRPPGRATRCGRPAALRRERLAGRLGTVQSSSGELLRASKVPVSSRYYGEEKMRWRKAGSGL